MIASIAQRQHQAQHDRCLHEVDRARRWKGPLSLTSRHSGVEPCVVRTWRKIVQTSLNRASVWHEECRNQEPVGHMMQLKRVARYLKGVPRKAQQHPAQEPSKAHVEVHVDRDWPGDVVTRRSTTGDLAQTQLNGTKRDLSE